MSKALLASVFALAAAVPVLSLSGCSPEVPANPSFARDVQPIFNGPLRALPRRDAEG